MNKRRLYFYGVFGAFHILAFVFTIVMETSPSFLLDLIGYIPVFKYVTFLGVVLVATDFVWTWLEAKAAKKNEENARLENNTLKAKVYDFQQAGKTPLEVPSAKPSPK